jgi:hypothetical protein
MTVKELKEALKDVPDDRKVEYLILNDGACGDIQSTMEFSDEQEHFVIEIDQTL